MKSVSKFNSNKPISRTHISRNIPNCLTVDIEDYFQVTAFSQRICNKDWDKFDCRIEIGTNRILSLLEEANVRGTFFVLGWIADRIPKLVERIASAGHEIACHGYWHQLVYDLKPQEFETDIVNSRNAIQAACDVNVTAYRAPSFSIVPRSRWALEILAKNGFKFDSSVFPIAGHDRYGDPDAIKSIHAIETNFGQLVEYPPTAGRSFGLPVPIGGGYFRLLPLSVTQSAINHVRRTIGPAMFYIHPWELDPDQPRVKQIGWKSRFRHYVGLRKTESRLRTLLKENEFSTLSEVVEAVLKNSIPVKGATHAQV